MLIKSQKLMAKSKSFFEAGALFCKAEPSPTLSTDAKPKAEIACKLC